MNPSVVPRLFSKKDICKQGPNEIALNINGLWRRFKLFDSRIGSMKDEHKTIYGENPNNGNIKFWKIILKHVYFIAHFENLKSLSTKHVISTNMSKPIEEMFYDLTGANYQSIGLSNLGKPERESLHQKIIENIQKGYILTANLKPEYLE